MAKAGNHACSVMTEETHKNDLFPFTVDWIAFIFRIVDRNSRYAWSAGGHPPTCGNRYSLHWYRATALDDIDALNLIAGS